MLLHITLSKVVFTSHCICFYYIMICPSSALLHLHDPNALSVDFEQVIISVILFTVLFANQIMICSTSVAHVPLVLSCLLNPSAFTADFKQVIAHCYLFPGCFFPTLLANQALIRFMSAAHVSPLSSPLHLWCVGRF